MLPSIHPSNTIIYSTQSSITDKSSDMQTPESVYISTRLKLQYSKDEQEIRKKEMETHT